MARRPDEDDDREARREDVVLGALGGPSQANHPFVYRTRRRHGHLVWLYGQTGSFVFAPTMRALPVGSELIASRPTEGLTVYFDIALMAGLVLAAPVIMYQVWLFVMPALYANEKKFVIPFIVLTGLGTVAGAAFSHYLLFPSMMGFLATFTLAEIKFVPRVKYVFEMYVRSLIGMVVVFQIPTLAFFLAKMRLITARFLWHHIRYAVLIIVITAAVLTPSPDPWNMAIFAAPMLCLYVIGIGVAWRLSPAPVRDSGLRLVFTAAVLDQAWKHHATARQRAKISGRG